MHRRVGHARSADELVVRILIHLLLGAGVVHSGCDRLASVGILLTLVRRLRCPVGRTVACFDHGIFLTRIAVGRHGDQRGITQLASPRVHALGSQIGVHLCEARLNDPGVGQCLTKQPEGLRIGHALMQIESEEPHEREPVPDLRVPLLSRHGLEGVQHQDLKYEPRIKRRTPPVLPRGAPQALARVLRKRAQGTTW